MTEFLPSGSSKPILPALEGINHLPTAALRYARHGLPVFPLCPGGKSPVIPKERGGKGYKDATTDEKKIHKWWQKWPEANIGIQTGSRSGFIVVDADGDKGLRTLANLERENGSLPSTLRSRTPSGGIHLYLEQPPDVIIPCSVGKLGPGIDVRGDGGYVVVPPSRIWQGAGDAHG